MSDPSDSTDWTSERKTVWPKRQPESQLPLRRGRHLIMVTRPVATIHYVVDWRESQGAASTLYYFHTTCVLPCGGPATAAATAQTAARRRNHNHPSRTDKSEDVPRRCGSLYPRGRWVHVPVEWLDGNPASYVDRASSTNWPM
jgi:hypothetical protein